MKKIIASILGLGISSSCFAIDTTNFNTYIGFGLGETNLATSTDSENNNLDLYLLKIGRDFRDLFTGEITFSNDGEREELMPHVYYNRPLSLNLTSAIGAGLGLLHNENPSEYRVGYDFSFRLKYRIQPEVNIFSGYQWMDAINGSNIGIPSNGHINQFIFGLDYYFR